MTNEKINPCNTCDVEPPALKFKCPECEHNPDTIENDIDEELEETSEDIACKYKYQNPEKFQGKPYCMLFNELCEDLFPCDDNCQVYEDYKELCYLQKKIEILEEKASSYKTRISRIYSHSIMGKLLPCGGVCSYPKCNDESTYQGRFCLQHNMDEIRKISEIG